MTNLKLWFLANFFFIFPALPLIIEKVLAKVVRLLNIIDPLVLVYNNFFNVKDMIPSAARTCQLLCTGTSDCLLLLPD